MSNFWDDKIPCLKCGNPLGDGAPYIPIGSSFICYGCMYSLIEEMARRNTFGIIPYYFESICDANFKRKARRAINKKLALMVLRKYKHICVSCGTTQNLSIDHIHPVSKGGKDHVSNLQVLCRSCNSKKGNKVCH